MKSHETKRHWIACGHMIVHKLDHTIVDASKQFGNLSEEVAKLLNKAHELGRQDEFNDNCAKTKKLLEEHGI